tara:strand:- start:266 stop:427 length:162 start_codon:yes stop_codon:yes gene_type:complete
MFAEQLESNMDLLKKIKYILEKNSVFEFPAVLDDIDFELSNIRKALKSENKND